MANNELSGPAVLTKLTTWLTELENRHFSYRISFHSETLGALCYIKNNEESLKANVVGAWNFTCMGGPDSISVLSSQYRNTMPDKVTAIALEKLKITPKFKDFLSRGSDERQFSSPRLGIPMVSVMKSPYGEYPEYHTSLDDLDFISENSLVESLNVMKEIILTAEKQKFLRQTFIGEAHLNKYGLYPDLTQSHTEFNSRKIMNLMQFCDGNNTVDEIAQLTKMSEEEVRAIINVLVEKKLIE
jgi:aminopeptidase-like protein